VKESAVRMISDNTYYILITGHCTVMLSKGIISCTADVTQCANRGGEEADSLRDGIISWNPVFMIGMEPKRTESERLMALAEEMRPKVNLLGETSFMHSNVILA
jgi:hypothetical protein